MVTIFDRGRSLWNLINFSLRLAPIFLQLYNIEILIDCLPRGSGLAVEFHGKMLAEVRLGSGLLSNWNYGLLLSRLVYVDESRVKKGALVVFLLCLLDLVEFLVRLWNDLIADDRCIGWDWPWIFLLWDFG